MQYRVQDFLHNIIYTGHYDSSSTYLDQSGILTQGELTASSMTIFYCCYSEIF